MLEMWQKELVEELSVNPDGTYPIVCNNLKRVYPAKDGNPPKYAVRGFTLAVPRGECFGILGPNGAGKTSSINMVCAKTKLEVASIFVQLCYPQKNYTKSAALIELSLKSLDQIPGKLVKR